MISRPSRVIQAQASVFFPSGGDVTHHLYRRLPERWTERLDGDPLLLPRNDNTPREIPIMVLSNRVGSERLTVSQVRADLRAELPASEEQPLGSWLDSAGEWLCELCREGGLRIGRLAAIAYRVTEVAEPAQALARHFCRPELVANAPLNRTETFELHAHKQYETAFGVRVNSWVRNKSGLLGPTQTPAVLVEQDVNTLAEELDARVMTDPEVRAFFSNITAELDETLALYYPEVARA